MVAYNDGDMFRYKRMDIEKLDKTELHIRVPEMMTNRMWYLPPIYDDPVKIYSEGIHVFLNDFLIHVNWNVKAADMVNILPQNLSKNSTQGITIVDVFRWIDWKRNALFYTWNGYFGMKKIKKLNVVTFYLCSNGMNILYIEVYV